MSRTPMLLRPHTSLCTRCRASTTPLLQPFLTAGFAGQRNASILSALSDNPSAYNKRIRRGRGPSSGKGKTSGRGHKGQKQHGKVPAGFEGGQTPLHIVHGERGFTNRFPANLTTVPISRIQSWVAQGRLSALHPITPRELYHSACVRPLKGGVKLLASSHGHDASLDAQPPLSQPLHIVVSRASRAAIQAVERAGGSVTTRYYTEWALNKIVRGQMHAMESLRSKDIVPQIGGVPTAAPETEPQATTTTMTAQEGDSLAPTDPDAAPVASSANYDARARTTDSSSATVADRSARRYRYRLPDPTGRKDMEYYRDPAHRGYLAHTVGKGQSPSLFFRPPGSKLPRRRRVGAEDGGDGAHKGAKSLGSENRLW